MAASSEKKTVQKIFFISVLTIAREMAKTKGKNLDKMCQLIYPSENIPTATETMTQKSSIYLLGISNNIFNFIFKIHNTHLLHLFLGMYILKSFF